MNILVHIGHPGHVHLFRNPIRTWMQNGHRVLIAIRDRPPIAELLHAYGLESHVASKPRPGIAGRMRELVEHDVAVLRLALRHRSDLLVGTSVAAAHVSRCTRARSILFEEDDADAIRLFAWLAYPFADAIAIPDCLRDRRGPRHVTYNGYHELAYLHPNHFTPNPGVIARLGLQPDEPFVLIRHVALTAFHDTRASGLSLEMMREIVGRCARRAKVFIQFEGPLPEVFAPYRLRIAPHEIHDVISHASLLISDSQTMTAEAAVMGVPSIRMNSFVGRLSYLEELEHRYGLTYGFRPGEEQRLMRCLDALLAARDRTSEWQVRRQRMLRDKIDTAQWIARFVESFGAGTA